MTHLAAVSNPEPSPASAAAISSRSVSPEDSASSRRSAGIAPTSGASSSGAGPVAPARLRGLPTSPPAPGSSPPPAERSRTASPGQSRNSGQAWRAVSGGSSGS